MKVKAVIMRPDRMNDIHKLKSKQVEGKTFRYNGCIYFLHPDRFMITWERPLVVFFFIPVFGLFRRYFTTYYYRQGMANPLPVPFWDDMIEKPIKHTYKIKAIKGDEIEEVTFETSDFKKIVNNGVSAEELASIFEPWFYKIIAPISKNAWDYLTMLCIYGTAMGIVYLIYILATGNYTLPIHQAAHHIASTVSPTPTPTGMP